MDAEEARLMEDIQRRRAELVTRAEGLKRSLTLALDPRERIKRHPLRGLLTSIGTGIFLGRMIGGGGRAAPRRAGAEPQATNSEHESPLLSLASSVLPTLLPTLLPAVMGPLMSLVLPRSPKRRGKTNSH